MSWYYNHLNYENGQSKKLFSPQYLSLLFDNNGNLFDRVNFVAAQALFTITSPLVVGASAFWTTIAMTPPGGVNLSYLYNWLFLTRYIGVTRQINANSKNVKYIRTIKEIGEYVRANHLPGFIYNLTIQDSASELWRSHGQIFEITPWGIGSEWARMGPGKSFLDWEFDKAMATSGAALAKPIQGCVMHSILDLCWVKYPWAYIRMYSGLTTGFSTWAFEEQKPKNLKYYFFSDGGHSENLGAFTLIKRHCQNIFIVDSEEEPKGEYLFEGYTVLRSLVQNTLMADLEVVEIKDYLEGHNACEVQESEDCKVATRNWKSAYMQGTIEGLPVGDGVNLNTNPLKLLYLKLSFDREKPRTMGTFTEGRCSSSESDYYSETIYKQAEKDPEFPMYPTSDQWLDRDQRIALVELGYAHMSAALCHEGQPGSTRFHGQVS